MGRLLVIVATVLLALFVAAPAHAVDPLLEGDLNGAAARAEGHNPSLGSKLVGYTRQRDAAGAPPAVLVLGNSRAVQLDPVLIERLGNGRAYNAAISDAAARELLAVGTLARLLDPQQFPHLLVMLDLEAFDRRHPTARVTYTLHAEQAAMAACSDPATCAGAWNTAARRIVSAARIGIRRIPSPDSTQLPNGMQVHGGLETLDAQGVDLAPVRARRIGIRSRSYRPGGGFDRVMPIPTAAFRKLLVLANAAGDRPTVVITSMHPDCIRICGAAGWNARHREVRALLAKLAHEHHQFRLIDASDPAVWGGSGASFFDEIHLRPAAAAKLVRWLDARGVLDRSAARLDPPAPAESLLDEAMQRMREAAAAAG
jgi:hypothetical protein